MWKQSLFPVYLLRFKTFYFKYRTIPSFSQCMEILGVQSKSVVHRFFQQMIEQGYLEKRHGVYYPADKLVALPLFDSVRAGIPDDATQTDVQMVGIEHYLVDAPEHTVLLSVIGDSMIEAWLYEDDIVVVDTKKQAHTWDIVIAVVDQEYTVKYLQKNAEKQFYLKAWNPLYSDIYPKEQLHIFGKVIGSFRRY